MRNEKTGIYQIRCNANGQIYIGSSKRIYTRWSEHRGALRRGKSNCVYLQNAWTKHGEQTFQFSIVEECEPAQLEIREQHYIDALKPAFNSIIEVRRRFGPEMRAKIAASLRARAAKITHCPRGHAYDQANTYRNKKGKRICRACNALRVNGVYASESPDERESRRQRVKAGYAANRQERLAANKAYNAARKKEKSEYDRQRRDAAKIAGTPTKWSKMTPEQKAARNAKRREDYKKEAPACSTSPP